MHESGELEDDWAPVATFVVELRARDGGRDGGEEQTSLHHIEGDRTESWPGRDPDRLVRLMTEMSPTPPVDRVDGPVTDATAGIPGVLALRAGVCEGRQTGYRSLDVGEPWSVEFEWSAGVGPVPDGEWVLDAVLVPVGSGAPFPVRRTSLRVPVDPEAAGYRIAMPTDAALVGAVPPDTLLRGTATITFRPAGAERALLAGFVDLGVLSFAATRASVRADG